ncbi:hypothetical protein K438DRAFT_1748052 [Mycena galopus ATCC 62051]|nr:hypothetical protein K438DRAFT_1748052 [Mycena galopus ATCC 62051]
MPRQPNVTKTQLDHISDCLTLALPLLNKLNDASGPPFVQSIANTVQALINSVKNVKQNKSECAQLMGNIHEVLCAIVRLHIKSETVGSLPPSMLDNIGKFIETLHKIYTFITAQQQGNKIKHLFRNHEMNTLLQECHAGLKQIQAEPQTLNEIKAFENTVDLMHRELAELIEKLSDTGTVSERSSVYLGFEESKNSSNSFSMLPSKPKIFHGREQELNHCLELISQQSPRITILGGGGMGKSSLARAVLHHPDISSKFENRFFITMRGAERPAKVKWSHPFLLPLQPLSNDAARQTFIEITDSSNTIEEMDQLLGFTDNMPLAVDLIAHLVDYEGFSNVFSRWKTEKTSLLSVGSNRQSSLDASISLSLSSPRITSDSRELLSLLSILPNGLSEAELMQSNMGIPNILSCKATLLATSLAYLDSNLRLLLLMPIREYIQEVLPPSQPLIEPVRKHFYALLELFNKHYAEQLQLVVNHITLNLANLQEILHQGLYSQSPSLGDTINCALSLNKFYRLTGRNHFLLLDDIQCLLSQLSDPQLETLLTREFLITPHYWNTVSEAMIAQAITHLDYTKDPVLSSQFYQAAGYYLLYYKSDLSRATQFLQKALDTSELCEDSNRQCHALVGFGWFKWHTGNYSAANIYATKAQHLAELSANLYQEASAIHLRASCSRFRGDYQDSAAQLHRAAELLHICGMSGGMLDHGIRQDHADIYLLKSDYQEARNIFCQVVERTSAEKNSSSYADALLNIGLIDAIVGEAQEDIYHKLEIAKDVLLRGGDNIIICDILEAIMDLREARFNKAKVTLQECLSLSWGTQPEIEYLCLEQLANIKAWPASGWQYKWPVIYLLFAHKSKGKLHLHKALLFLGDVFIVNEDDHTAANLYEVALAGFTQMDVHHS